MALAMPKVGQPFAMPKDEGDTFEITHHMLKILPTFHGLAHDNPNCQKMKVILSRLHITC